MSHPFGTSLRRDPGDPRGLKEQIETVLLERLEEAVDTACLDLLVELRRARNLPAPAAGRTQDRAEFEGLVQAFVDRLDRSIPAGLDAEQRDRLAPRPPAAAARVLALQVALAQLLPDYWQRFETVKGEFWAKELARHADRPGLLRRLLGSR